MKKQRKDNSLIPDDNKDNNNKQGSKKGWWIIGFLMCVAIIIILYPYFSGYETNEDLDTDPISYVIPANPDTAGNSTIFAGTFSTGNTAELAA